MNFIDFLKEKEFMTTLIALIISRETSYITNSFIDDIIMPIINRDSDSNGVEDIDELKKLELKAYGANIKIGNFIITIIKDIIIMSIVYIFYNLVSKLWI